MNNQLDASCDSAMKQKGRIEINATKINDGICQINVMSSSFFDDGVWQCNVEPCLNENDEKKCEKSTNRGYDGSIYVKVKF